MNSFVTAEIASQPETWVRAAQLLDEVASALPRTGERVAVLGCGTSWFVAMNYAATRERALGGITDAFAGSELPGIRDYDRILAISRSGTTTEIIDQLRAAGSRVRTTLITAVAGSPAADLADDVIVLPFADEQSVVQTRFPTTVIVLLRASLGEDTARLVDEAHRALEIDVDPYLSAQQVTFIGRGAAVGLCNEAALKSREAAQFWSESYPAMEYRHGPIAIAQPGRLVWSLGAAPVGIDQDVTATGARFVNHGLDPLTELVVAQRFAIGLAQARGLNADRPRALTRSVILAS